MEKEFIRVRSLQDIVISFLLIISGSVLVALPTSTSVNILGFFMLFAGLILVLILKSAYKMEGTGEIFKRKEKFFPQSSRDTVAQAVSKSLKSLNLAEEDRGNGLRLDIYYNIKSGKALCRLYEYVPYKYEPCTPFYEYSVADIDYLIK